MPAWLVKERLEELSNKINYDIFKNFLNSVLYVIHMMHWYQIIIGEIPQKIKIQKKYHLMKLYMN